MTTEKKVIGGIALLTVVILVGAVFFFSQGSNASNKTASVSEEDVVAFSGIHWHPRVTIYVKGEKKVVPNGIGLNGTNHNPVHTHDDANKDIVHLEFSGLVKKDETKLGKFFQIWGKEFNSTQLFDKKSGSEGTVKMLVNGQENTEFENYLMKDNDSIEIRYE